MMRRPPRSTLSSSSAASDVYKRQAEYMGRRVHGHLLEEIDNQEKVYQLLRNSGFNNEEINSIIASLEFILSNSTRYDISDVILLKELINLGLPKENCDMIGKAFKENKEKLKYAALKKFPRTSKFVSINYSINDMISSNQIKNVPEDYSQYASINIAYQETEKPAQCNFVIFRDKLEELISELGKAQEIMEKF
eukprot:TRINITY_DN19660_c0_g1_i2.p2 TRINITY_DN19660_c0_g1~~TRINITY_DN19660_c0_g1_i2.p2  ORF type:complete len:194 (+),score=59.77 TRINITY_DN19660_c0_g1_i2:66-647(+)